MDKQIDEKQTKQPEEKTQRNHENVKQKTDGETKTKEANKQSRSRNKNKTKLKKQTSKTDQVTQLYQTRSSNQ
jgi:hypothetical protein